LIVVTKTERERIFSLQKCIRGVWGIIFHTTKKICLYQIFGLYRRWTEHRTVWFGYLWEIVMGVRIRVRQGVEGSGNADVKLLL